MHPSDRGHKIIAEALAGILLRALAEAAAPLPANSKRHDPQLEGLPPPMVPNNADSPTTLCAMQVHFACCSATWPAGRWPLAVKYWAAPLWVGMVPGTSGLPESPWGD